VTTNALATFAVSLGWLGSYGTTKAVLVIFAMKLTRSTGGGVTNTAINILFYLLVL
jgi:hypothetical protein